MVKCSYCGEEEGTEKIVDPNMDMESIITSWWIVCKDCKRVIYLQQRLSIAEIMNDRNYASKCNAELEEIATRTKKPILNACISKGEDGCYNSTSIEFTGKQ